MVANQRSVRAGSLLVQIYSCPFHAALVEHLRFKPYGNRSIITGRTIWWIYDKTRGIPIIQYTYAVLSQTIKLAGRDRAIYSAFH